ncbi:MAG TPA: hypothetical protein VIN10_01915 [Bacteroidales bacterium]
MKSIIYKLSAVLVFLTFSLFSISQEANKSGGYGFFAPGIMIGSLSNLETNLQTDGLLASSENLPSISTNIGGGGYGLMDKRLIVGGYGFGNFFSKTTSSVATIKLAGGGLIAQVGFAAYNKKNMLIFPTVGFGFMGTTMTIDNTSSKDQHFGDNLIPAGSIIEASEGNAMLDIAVNFNKLLSKTGNSGFCVGASVGYMLSLSDTDWQNVQTKQAITGVDDTGYNGFYVKVIIGGGGFKLN